MVLVGVTFVLNGIKNVRNGTRTDNVKLVLVSNKGVVICENFFSRI